MKKKDKTSWGSVASWYDAHLESNDDTYQKQVILPNILRILDLKKGEKVLDLACGQGFFSREFDKRGARVIGCDISEELITLAKEQSEKGITYHTTQANDFFFSGAEMFNTVVCILALQNIEDLAGTYREVSRILMKEGRFVFVINHPAFRIPKESNWGWDDTVGIQFRRIDRYLSAGKVAINMHPGMKNSAETVSYHRSLQDFFKAGAKAGFATIRFEEWISHKKSERGLRQKAENTARKEIPLFLMIEAKKCAKCVRPI